MQSRARNTGNGDLIVQWLPCTSSETGYWGRGDCATTALQRLVMVYFHTIMWLVLFVLETPQINIGATNDMLSRLLLI